MYEWGEAMQYVNSVNCDPCGTDGVQGICAAGYHIPSDLEWSHYEWCVENNILPAGGTSLSTFQTGVGWRGSTSPTAGVGAKLKASSSNSPAWSGTNASGFTALPAGFRFSGGGFSHLGLACDFWSATEQSHSSALYRHLDIASSQSSRWFSKLYGFSARCIQN